MLTLLCTMPSNKKDQKRRPSREGNRVGWNEGVWAFVLIDAGRVRKYYGINHYGTIFGILLTGFGIGAFVGPVFEGIAVSSSLGYLPGFLLAAVVSLAVGAHLAIVGRRTQPPL